MVERFSQRTVRQDGGIPPEEWIRKYVVNGTLAGEEKVSVVRANGKTESVPRRLAAIVFRDLKTVRDEDRSNRGGAPAVTATPQVALVHLHDGMRAQWGIEGAAYVNGEVIKDDVVIPLGFPTSASDQIVFMQCGRLWVSKGANNLSMTNDNVVNTFMPALQSIVWTISNDISQRVQCKRFEALVLFAGTVNAYFTQYPEAFKIVEPLRDDDRARDSLQRALAFIFFDEPWSKEELLRLVEIMLKRHRRHNPGTPDFITQPIAGIIGCLIVVPLLHRLLHRVCSVEAAVKELNEKTEDLVRLMCDHIRDVDVEQRNKLILARLVDSCPDLKLKTDDVGKLYGYCMDMKNFEQLAPFDSWGLLPVVNPPFNIITSGFTINGSKTNTVVKVKRKEKEGAPADTMFEVIPSAPSEWNAFALSTEGTYKLRVSLIGPAEQAKGNSLGVVNAANLRFTSGTEILPTDREGKSSAGMHHRQNRYGRYGYEKTGETLKLGPDADEIIITIRNDTCTVSQPNPHHRRPFFTYDIQHGDPVLIGFKFVKFVIQYEPHHPAIGDLTGAALMSKLRDLALNEKNKTPI